MRKFTSSPDSIATNIPYFIFGLAIFSTALNVFIYTKTHHSIALLLSISLAPVLLLTILIGAYYYKTLSLTVGNYGITIDRKAKPVITNFSEIISVRAVQKDEMKYTIRTFGNGGVFGYTGKYYNRKLGSMTWFCTQRKNYILIEKTDNKKIVVTPDDPQGFLQEIKAVQPSLVEISF